MISYASAGGGPVYIVVCNNTNVSKMVFDAISGYEESLEHYDGTRIVHRGELPLFDNATDQYRWAAHQKTILVDSSQLESEDALSPDFKKLMAHQIEEFRRSTSQDIDDAALMREVLNTVGKKGKLGEGIRCVVSVSMLTEGWDANTVTHIVGVRAFASSLIREQVIGRGLRRVSYAVNAEGKFDPEYAEVYGVPFRYLPVAGQPPEGDPKPPPPMPGAVKALPERLIDARGSKLSSRVSRPTSTNRRRRSSWPTSASNRTFRFRRKTFRRSRRTRPSSAKKP